MRRKQSAKKMKARTVPVDSMEKTRMNLKREQAINYYIYDLKIIYFRKRL